MWRIKGGLINGLIGIDERSGRVARAYFLLNEGSCRFFVVEVLGKIGSEYDRHHLMEILLLQNIPKAPISLLASTEVSTFNMPDYLRYKHHLYRNVFDRDFSGNYFNVEQLSGSVRGFKR